MQQGHKILILLLLAVSSVVNAAADDARPERPSEARLRLLSASPDPDAWLLGAWMASAWCQTDAADCDPVRAALLFERVLAQPPENPTLLRILIGQLPQSLKGDPARLVSEKARLLARVQALDPQSLPSWLPALPDSTDLKRRAEGAAVLARAAQSTRAGEDFSETYRWLAKRLAKLPLEPSWVDNSISAPPEYAHRALAFAMSSAMATPGYLQVSRWCKEPGSWIDDCRAIARLFASGDTILDRSLGKSMLKRLARTDAEQAEAQNIAAQVDWLWAASAKCRVMEDQSVLSLWDQEGVTEISLIEAQLEARGLPIKPPVDAAMRKYPCGKTGVPVLDDL